MINSDIICKLSELGNSNSESPELFILIDSLRDSGFVNRLHWKEWNSAAGSMRTSDVVTLAKGLTLAEKYLREWSSGSVSAVIWVFQEVRRRDIKLSQELADWILPRTTNPYVPFGTQNHGAKSCAEYRLAESRRREIIHKGIKEQEIREKRAKAERKLRMQQRSRSTQDRNTEKRIKFLADLKALTIQEQLRQLAGDTVYSVEFYPTCCADETTSEIIASLDTETKLALLEKLKGKRRGPWSKLKKLLLSWFQGGRICRSTPWDSEPWFK